MSDEFEDDAARAAWVETLPEDVRGWQEAATAKSPEAFWKQLGEIRSQVGRSLVLPTSEATPETRAAFYQKLVEATGGEVLPVPKEGDEEGQAAYRQAMGVPDSPDGYEMPEVDGMPEGLIPDARSKAIRDMAHKHGLPAKQFKALANDILTMDLAEFNQRETHIKDREGELRSEWGDDYDRRYHQVVTFLEHDGAPKNLIGAAQHKRLGPEAAKYLHGLITRVSGEAAEIAGQTGGASRDTRDDIAQKISEMYDPKHPFMDASHPEHARALERRIDLQRKLSALDEKPTGRPRAILPQGVG